MDEECLALALYRRLECPVCLPLRTRAIFRDKCATDLNKPSIESHTIAASRRKMSGKVEEVVTHPVHLCDCVSASIIVDTFEVAVP